MNKGVIPLIDLRQRALRPPLSAPAESGASTPVDALGRELRDLRISVTDRCNFRCTYCMPKEVFDRDYRYLPHADLLSFEEITRLARSFVDLGVEKIRLTGGEPLLRKDIERLVEMLARLTTPSGQPLDLTLTTNGSLLERKARTLVDAGLKRVTVSLDALDDAVFKRMNDVDFPVASVLDGIAAASAVGLSSIKINMVVKRGTNDHQVLPMARHFRGSGHVLRFIEFMDVGTSNGWRMNDVLPSRTVLDLIEAELPLEPIGSNYAGEVAQRWRYRDGSGEIGVISSVTQAFCGSCTRARLSTEGKLYLCLFAHQGYDLRQILRDASLTATDQDAELARTIATIWGQRSDRYSELRGNAVDAPAKVEMSYIGG